MIGIIVMNDMLCQTSQVLQKRFGVGDAGQQKYGCILVDSLQGCFLRLTPLNGW